MNARIAEIATLATLQAENLRLKLLVAAFTVVDDLDADPLIRVVEAAHKHGRKLEREELRAEIDAVVEALRSVTAALEASFPGDESVGAPEFPSMPLSEAWKRRLDARALLAKYPVKP